MKSDQMGTGHNNPSPRELPLSNQTRFRFDRNSRVRLIIKGSGWTSCDGLYAIAPMREIVRTRIERHRWNPRITLQSLTRAERGRSLCQPKPRGRQRTRRERDTSILDGRVQAGPRLSPSELFGYRLITHALWAGRFH